MRGGSVGFIDDAQAAWNNALADLQQKAYSLDDAEQRLYDAYALAQNDPEDAAEWQRLFNKVNALKSTLDSIRSGMSTVTNWWDSFTGSIPGLSGYKQLGAAGFLLPVGIGAITAATAGIVALTASISAFLVYLGTKNNYLSGLESDVAELQASGASPEQIADYVDSRVNTAKQVATEQSGYSVTGDLVKIAGLTIVGIGLVLILPKLLEGKRA